MKKGGCQNALGTKLFSKDADNFDQGLPRSKRFPLLVVLWLVLAVMFAADLSSEPIMLTAWFTLPALVAAIFVPTRYVVPLALGALACALVSGMDNHALGTTAYQFRLGAVTLSGIVASVFAAVQTRRLKLAESERILREEAHQETDKISHEAKEQIQELELLARQLMQKQEQEHQTISRELHDNIAQVLTAVTTRLSLANTTQQTPAWLKQELKDLQGHLNDALTDIRLLARELRPALLDHCGFAAALDKHAQDFHKRTSIDIELQVDPSAASDFNPEKLTHLFRVVQEAMQNIEEHSGATRAWLRLTQGDGKMHLEIGDNGCAFTSDRVTEAQRDGHLGLLGMRERAELLGGSFLLQATPGQGTNIRVSAPVRLRETTAES